MMKNIKKILMLILVIGITASAGFLIVNGKDIYINKVLTKKEYSYLPKEAQNIVKDVYKKTGNVVLTEKNKEENVPYLNPKYVEYLSMSSQEKKDLEVIPNPYTVEYSYKNVKSGNYPSSYDLRNDNLITPLKNQKSLGICWSFSAIEQAESLLMKTKNQTYNDNSKIFSPRQLDYAISNNGLKEFTNTHGFRELGEGGNFYMSSELMSYGLGLTDESSMPFNESLTQKEVSEVLNFTNSNYEVNETVDLPLIAQRELLDYETAVSECSDNNYDMADLNACLKGLKDEIKASYISEIKNGIKNYGGVVVEATSPDGNCAFKNTDNAYVIEDNDICYSSEEGHAMHIIGWDDSYEYSYCSGDELSSLQNNTCPQGTRVDGQGAFIVRNSWGNSAYSYVYLTYDSIDDGNASPTFYYIKNMSSTGERTWDNVYLKQLDYSQYLYFSSRITQTFNKKISGREKVEKIKFNTITVDAPYSISIIDGNTAYTYNQIIETEYPGIYTIDLSDKNIILNNDSFDIVISTNKSKAYAIKNSISVFTSNVDETPVIKNTNLEDLTIDKGTAINRRIYSVTKNIDSGETLNYSLKKVTGEDASNYLTVTNNVVAENEVNAKVIISSALPVGEYVLVQSYNGVEKETSITVVGPQVTVTFNSNDGTNSSYTQTVDKETTFILRYVNFEKTGYKFDCWTTNPNGSGTRYDNQQTITDGLISNLTLYAQWKPIKYYISFDAAYYSSNPNEPGTMATQTFTYDSATYLNPVTFVRTGYKFVGWTRDTDDLTNLYQDRARIYNLVDDEYTITFYAVWEPIQYTVRYDSNGGTGTMTDQIFTYDNDYQELNRVQFTKTGYHFLWWNTKADDSGRTLNDRHGKPQLSTVDNDLVTLYAIWEANYYKVTFNANGGTGTMNDFTIQYDSYKKLPVNTFEREDYNFLSWNTEPDGTGETYIDGQEMTLDSNITLYAIWSRANGSITYNSNDDSNQYKVQEFNFNEDTVLEDNAFVRDGYNFKEWNTKADGTGTSYTNKQTINENNDLVLYVIWEEIKYTITFNMRNSTLTKPANMTVTPSETITLPKVQNNSDYNFVDWYKDYNCTIRFTNTHISNNITLYAKYTKNINSTFTVTGIVNKTYTGKNLTQKFAVYDGSTIVRYKTDFIVAYSNNKNIGTATVTIHGIGDYASYITKTFKILPKAPTLKKVTSPKKGYAKTVTNSVAGGVYYQIAYKIKGGSSWTKYNTKGTTKTRKGFKSKKYYYFTVRTYKKVNGKVYYSPWSNRIKVKIK